MLQRMIVRTDAPLPIDVGVELAQGRYQVVEKIGEGGFGVVYRALEHSESLHRQVAIKVLHRHLFAAADRDAETAIQRFRAEIRLIAELNHPNIINIHYDGRHGDELYFVMEYLKHARSMQALFEAARAQCAFIPLTQIRDCFMQVAAGLRAIHCLPGVIHRDIKLDNILVAQPVSDECPVVKIVDFGIAHEPGNGLTQTGQVVGTPSYVAPEMLACADDGSPLPLDQRVDLYALGAAMYAFSTLKMPFESIQASASKYDAVPPSNLRPMPSTLEAIILRLLAKDRDERYPDACAVIEDLRAFDVGEPFVGKSSASVPRATRDVLPSLGDIRGLHVPADLPEAGSGAVSLRALERSDSPSHQADGAGENQALIDVLNDRPASKRALNPRDKAVLAGAGVIFCLFVATAFTQWRHASVRIQPSGLLAGLQARPTEKPPISARDILHDARESETYFVERPALRPAPQPSSQSFRGAARPISRPQPVARREVAIMPAQPPPTAEVSPKPDVVPAADNDLLSRYQTTLVSTGNMQPAATNAREPLGIPLATLAPASLTTALTSDRPQTLVVARLPYGVTVGTRRIVPAGAKLIGRATYQERGGQWFAELRFYRLLLPGVGGQPDSERSIEAIATQGGQAGLRARAIKVDQRGASNVGEVLVKGVRKLIDDVPGRDLADPFLRDGASDARESRHRSIAAQLPRGTTFQAQFSRGA